MKCEQCQGLGHSQASLPCGSCGGSGISSCCEGAVGLTADVTNSDGDFRAPKLVDDPRIFSKFGEPCPHGNCISPSRCLFAGPGCHNKKNPGSRACNRLPGFPPPQHGR